MLILVFCVFCETPGAPTKESGEQRRASQVQEGRPDLQEEERVDPPGRGHLPPAGEEPKLSGRFSPMVVQPLFLSLEANIKCTVKAFLAFSCLV